MPPSLIAGTEFRDAAGFEQSEALDAHRQESGT
jgi:hypothetical protein